MSSRPASAAARDQAAEDIRVALRWCERSARLYRRLGLASTWLSAICGAAMLSALSPVFPVWVPIAGSAMLVLFASVAVALRSAGKAQANEADARRYARLAALAHTMPLEQLRFALDRLDAAGLGDRAPALRDVACNDVARERGRLADVRRLSAWQRAVAVLS